MKNIGKTIYSLLAVSVFIVLGIATSKDEDLADLAIYNSSSDCQVNNIALYYSTNGTDSTNYDIVDGVLPGDSMEVLVPQLNYRNITYTCTCPNDTTVNTVDISTLANTQNMGVVETGCD